MNNGGQLIYTEHGFKALRCKGFHPQYNSQQDYSTAKQALDSGFTKEDFSGLTLSGIEVWEQAGGWVGWVIPKGYIAIDVEDGVSIDYIKTLCRTLNIKPPEHNSNKGKHFFFKISENLSAASEVFTKSGAKVTYRVGGKNYLILAPTNGRSWEVSFLKVPELPAELHPYDQKSVDDILNVLSWHVGDAYRKDLFHGYDDIDTSFMVFLIECQIPEERIHESFKLIFNSSFDEGRTQTMYDRAKDKIVSGEAIRGTGTFIHRLKEMELKEIENFSRQLLRATGVKYVTFDTFDTFDYDKNIIPETDFPFNVFKDDFFQVVNIASKAIHIEPEIVAAVMLAIVSATIGNPIRVSPKKGYTVPLFVWLIVIALSGHGKSPLMILLMRHIKELQGKEYMEYEKRLKTYERALRDAKNDDTLSIPEIPKLRHFEVVDNTVEALTTIFKQDPRGTISNQDEIASLILGLNQYKGKGNDREQYLSVYNCQSIKVDRKGKTIFIPNTGLSIIGGIHPKKMPSIFESDSFDDGFIARFLTINGNKNSIEFSREFVTDETIQYWIALIDYCYSVPLKLDENGFVKFKTLILSEDAIEAYISFYNDYGKKMLFLTERARVFIPKLIAYYCLKFSGILHVLNCYHDNIPSDAIPQLIDIETMSHAIALTKFFAGQVIQTVMLYDKKESLNEFQEVLIQVLYDLREDVTGGKILLSRIVEVYNSRIPSEMTPHAVSAMLRDFGLITEKKGLNLSYLLWEPTKIQKLF
ncbi:MAG: DUF3987 domain-containing protein, partial [Candidatus Woesearchaeota archaeon]